MKPRVTSLLRICLCLIAVIVLLPGCDTEPASPTIPPAKVGEPGINGSVAAEGVPITQAEVSLFKGPNYNTPVDTTLSDAAGNYAFPNLPAGEYRVVPAHGQFTFTPVFASVTLKPDAMTAVASFTGQRGNVLRLVLAPMGTQMPTPGSVGAIVYKESPSFEAPTAEGIQMANKEADGSYFLVPLLKESKTYYNVCPVARGYIFEPECAAIETPTRPSIVTLSFKYKPR